MAVVIVLWIILYACSTSSDNKKYLGQAPPSLKPEVFAPGLISKKGESEFGSVFNKEANQFYYGADINGRSEIRFTTLEKETWGPPQTLLSNEKYSCNDPFLSPDEQRLYFISNRAVDGLGTKDDYDIWYIERNGNTWNTKMINAGPQINSGKNEYYMSFTTNGDMYFSSNTMASEKREHNYDIYVSGYGKGIFQKPNVLSNSINTEAYEADVFVAPDESYIIFCSIRRDGYGKGNLYISFREDGGNWSEAKNMGPQINTKVMFYETLAHDIYNHPVKHIYLCHDNAINADYLAEIISLLKQEDYKIVSFEEALADPVYEQKDAYYKKWGISWLYRWMDTQKERIKRMKQEPDLSGIEKLYEDIQKKNH